MSDLTIEQAADWGERVAQAWPDRNAMGELAAQYIAARPPQLARKVDGDDLADARIRFIQACDTAYGNAYRAGRAHWGRP